MAATADNLHDIPDPERLLPGIEIPLWFWVVFATVLCAIATALFFYLRCGQRPAPEEDTSYADSRRALERLQESLSGRSRAEVATNASLIIRHYLVVTLQEPALYETHEEFILRSDALGKLPAGARNRLAPLLDQLAEAKYGPSAADDYSSAGIVNSCLEVLSGLESTREPNVA